MTDVNNRTAETTTKFLMFTIEMKFESYRSIKEGGEWQKEMEKRL